MTREIRKMLRRSILFLLFGVYIFLGVLFFFFCREQWILAMLLAVAGLLVLGFFCLCLGDRQVKKLVKKLNEEPLTGDAEAEFAPMRSRLETKWRQEAQSTRAEFSANVSHELKTPLQSVLGSAELLENGLVQPEDIPRFAGHIKTEASRLLELINDIIRLSQMDENAPLPKEAVDLKELTQEVLRELKPQAEQKEVSLEIMGRVCVYTGVRRYLYQIIYNLCDNAIRYNRQGGRVVVHLSRAGQKLVLSVEDTGIGIPPEHLERIFERFYRVDKSHTRQTGGTGLGLSIVKHGVACHDGQIELESTPGVGTTVRVYL